MRQSKTIFDKNKENVKREDPQPSVFLTSVPAKNEEMHLSDMESQKSLEMSEDDDVSETNSISPVLSIKTMKRYANKIKKVALSVIFVD